MAQPVTRSVLKYFPKAVLPLRGYSWQVEKLYGHQLSEIYSADLRESVADGIRANLARRSDSYDSIIEDLSKRFGVKTPKVPWIDASKVDIIVPDKGILVLWPPTFYCSKCKTFYYTRDEPVTRCTECGNYVFIQVPLCHVCTQCSRYQPLSPPQKLARRDSRGFFVCEKCGQGKIRLEVKRRKLSDSRWRCGNCEQEERLMEYCTHVGGQPQLQPMQLKLTTQEPIRPVVISRVYVGGNRVEDAIEAGGLDVYVSASQVLHMDELNYLENVFCIDASNLLLLRDVAAVICTYGYSTGRDAYVKFFEEYGVKGKKYMAYASISEGNAILVKMKPYNGDRFTFLHTVEHALTKACHLLAGVQEGAFMGKILEDSNAVLIYEAAGSEQGGLEYIFRHRLPQLFTEALKLLFTCKYDCDEACPGCVYIRDPLCHPTSGYFIPNSSLNRKLVLKEWMKNI